MLSDVQLANLPRWKKYLYVWAPWTFALAAIWQHCRPVLVMRGRLMDLEKNAKYAQIRLELLHAERDKNSELEERLNPSPPFERSVQVE